MSPVHIALRVLFALCILIGFVWLGQGSGPLAYPASSFMIEQTPWIFYGAALAVVGLFGLFRLRNR